MRTSPIEALREALRRCDDFLSRYPDLPGLRAARHQLAYLTAVTSGQERDLSKVRDITLGRLAAREFDGWEDDFRELLFDAQEIADSIK